MKILVADDSRAMRMLVVRALRQAGADGDITEAQDGAEAFDVASGHDLILSDWNMPNVTGIELLRKLRAAGNRTPFVFVTSESTAEMRQAAAAAGALGLIAKPFEAHAVAELLRSVQGATR